VKRLLFIYECGEHICPLSLHRVIVVLLILQSSNVMGSQKFKKKSIGLNCHRGDKEGRSKKGQKTNSPQEPNKKGER
jgi:hypothetical protein